MGPTWKKRVSGYTQPIDPLLLEKKLVDTLGIVKKWE